MKKVLLATVAAATLVGSLASAGTTYRSVIDEATGLMIAQEVINTVETYDNDPSSSTFGEVLTSTPVGEARVVTLDDNAHELFAHNAPRFSDINADDNWVVSGSVVVTNEDFVAAMQIPGNAAASAAIAAEVGATMTVTDTSVTYSGSQQFGEDLEAAEATLTAASAEIAKLGEEGVEASVNLGNHGGENKLSPEQEAKLRALVAAYMAQK
ncbi:MAG: hypothetical protein N0C84_00735 [Candidatus Thiodiazotropha taylori]|uniref:Uncharacterized protein n=1 Tax=Candidatus Thiodiazotropha taylori TaxID=2792791 RepID=A0A9E4KA74_9GAMM|nr:hypothetical protein [Candidatus Thiodiazotropha taylori]MCW4254971.1 hypothetical protein [Candidatus Thiodiazotropha taylori]